MQLLEQIPRAGSLKNPSVVTVGVFDGMHLGHRALLERLLQRARELDCDPVVFSFREHPDALLKGSAPPPLTTIDERLGILEALGCAATILAPFTEELRDSTAKDFARGVLVDALDCKSLVLGFDSAICRRREGTLERFAELGVELGFSAERVCPVEVAGVPVSSSRIREALETGELELANRFLGRPYRLAGEVIHGERRGRSLGRPTANLLPPPLCLPENGVYATSATIGGRTHPAVTNVGTRPTFQAGSRILIETHLLDFHGDIYGQELTLDFRHRLRDEQRFESAGDLEAQIRRDVEDARRLLAVVGESARNHAR